MKLLRKRLEHLPSAAQTLSGARSISDYRQAFIQRSGLQGGRSSDKYPRPISRHVASVITVSFNSSKTIIRTIDSVAAQTYPHIEYIIVDGGSTDGTLELLRSREYQIDIWISEPDEGISDAFNKGIALASGEYIAILNSDDWMEPNQINDAIKLIEQSRSDFAFGNVELHDALGQSLYNIIGDRHYQNRILNQMPAINHPSVICNRRIYEQHGLYNCTFRLAMDYEWLLRIHKGGANGIYVSTITSHMENTGISNTQVLNSLREVRRASILHGYPKLFADLRFYCRAIRLQARLFIEHYFSKRLAAKLRSLINPHYNPKSS